jgi:DNA-binding transcriptional MerR regulator
MFRIGDFSRIARVSCRLLRYYDELGLLKPSTIGADSGYRYYTAAQLERLNRILVLKDLGFSLDEVARILEAKLSADELRGMLLMRRREVARTIETELEQLRHIEARITQIEMEGKLSADDVVIRNEPAAQILSMRQIVGSFVEARQLLATLNADIATHIKRSAVGNLMALAHSPEFELDRIDLEAGFILNERVDKTISLNSRVLTQRTLPAERVAACVRIGLPEYAHLITAKIAQFIEANGYRLAGPSREVFLQPPNPQRMEESIVEMQYPIAALNSSAGSVTQP